MNKLILTLFITIPLCGYSQLSVQLEKMLENDTPLFSEYEQSFYEATDYIFKNPGDLSSNEFKSALKIIDFWKNKDTGINVPTFGSFYESLEPRSNLRYFYMIAITNHILNEKINKDRFLKCVKLPGETFSEQDDVREAQLEGAKILLAYISDNANKIKLNKDAKPYLKAYQKGNLDDYFFEE